MRYSADLIFDWRNHGRIPYGSRIALGYLCIGEYIGEITPSKMIFVAVPTEQGSQSRIEDEQGTLSGSLFTEVGTHKIGCLWHN